MKRYEKKSGGVINFLFAAFSSFFFSEGYLGVGQGSGGSLGSLVLVKARQADVLLHSPKHLVAHISATGREVQDEKFLPVAIVVVQPTRHQKWT